MSAADDDMRAELERLRAENAQLRDENERTRSGPREISLKVSEKGGISVYGLGRWPVTLYKEQWLRLLAIAPEIQAYIKANEGRLKSKKDSS